MAKKRVNCPDCAHRFTIQIEGLRARRIGVRSKRITPGRFEYIVTAPDTMVEAGRFDAVTDDLILTAALAVPVGACFGFMASIVAPDYALQSIGLGASVGVSLAWGWLCAEHNQRLKRVLPWFIEQKEGWVSVRDDTIGGNVSLSIDHRYRDGSTETGRTIQYFGVLPVEVERFSQWAAAVLGTDRLPGQSLAIAHWTGSDGLFSRKEYEEVLALLRKGEAVINQPGKGNVLTGGGRRALRQHLKAHPPTPPQERA